MPKVNKSHLEAAKWVWKNRKTIHQLNAFVDAFDTHMDNGAYHECCCGFYIDRYGLPNDTMRALYKKYPNSFEYPDYMDMPKRLSNKVSSAFIDFVQAGYMKQYKTFRSFYKALLSYEYD